VKCEGEKVELEDQWAIGNRQRAIGNEKAEEETDEAGRIGESSPVPATAGTTSPAGRRVVIAARCKMQK